jgi:hypothetical protein
MRQHSVNILYTLYAYSVESDSRRRYREKIWACTAVADVLVDNICNGNNINATTY